MTIDYLKEYKGNHVRDILRDQYIVSLDKS